MYTKRIQIRNYGPIDHVDITFPFAEGEEKPKPVLLVGENGSGKSILLSHIVDGLLQMQGEIYPENSEVEQGKVYKIRSSKYIKSGNGYYWKQVDYEKGLHCEELHMKQKKREGAEIPADLVGSDMAQLWSSIPVGEQCDIMTNFHSPTQKRVIQNAFDRNSILHFPHNRFEDPAWLNEVNLKARAEYMELKHTHGYTDRKIINYSPLHDNKNWLFEVLFDRCAFEVKTELFPCDMKNQKGNYERYHVRAFLGYGGMATNIHETVLWIIQRIFRVSGELVLGIGKRQNRVISLIQDNQHLVPNIFQLSSGETALLNLFLSILRDFDLSRASFTTTEDVRGIVIVDEMDLHLHSIHQHEVLPELIKMFPRVQFIVTTHSPLFVLGMKKAFGPDGFAVYRMPDGQQINPEEFSEFGNAYQSFTETQKFADHIKREVRNSQKPIVFVEGETDAKYLRRAAELLGKKSVLEQVELSSAEGSENLTKIWKFTMMETITPSKIVLLYDCDSKYFDACDKEKVSRRIIPKQEKHPLEKGIENLFGKETLKRALKDKRAYIDITGERLDTERGEDMKIPEKWTVNKDEKTNLCDWLCENGTAEDFKHFREIFDLLEGILAGEEGDVAPEHHSQHPQPI